MNRYNLDRFFFAACSVIPTVLTARVPPMRSCPTRFLFSSSKEIMYVVYLHMYDTYSTNTSTLCTLHITICSRVEYHRSGWMGGLFFFSLLLFINYDLDYPFFFSLSFRRGVRQLMSPTQMVIRIRMYNTVIVSYYIVRILMHMI